MASACLSSVNHRVDHTQWATPIGCDPFQKYCLARNKTQVYYAIAYIVRRTMSDGHSQFR